MSVEKVSVVTFEGRAVVDTRVLLKQEKVKATLRRIAEHTSGVGALSKLKKPGGGRQPKPDAL